MDAPHPWEQQYDEPPKAYRAFRAYLDMDRGARSVPAAYRLATGKPNAKQADGNWNHWAREFDWAARARAHDAHLDAARLKAEREAAMTLGERWARMRIDVAERAYRIVLQHLDQCEWLAKFPVVSQSKSQDGRTVTWEAIEPRFAQTSTLMLRNAYTTFRLAVEDIEAMTRAAVSTDARAPAGDAQARAAAELAEWQAVQRRNLEELSRIIDTPPTE